MFNKGSNNSARDGGPPPGLAPLPEKPAGPSGPAAEASMIDSGLKVIGNMESDGDIVVAGTVEGDIASRGLTIGEGATVKGTITVGAVHVLGRVEGEIRTRSIRISASGEVAGNIKYETLAVEEGARIDGHLGKIQPGAERGKAQPAAAGMAGATGAAGARDSGKPAPAARTDAAGAAAQGRARTA